MCENVTRNINFINDHKSVCNGNNAYDTSHVKKEWNTTVFKVSTQKFSFVLAVFRVSCLLEFGHLLHRARVSHRWCFTDRYHSVHLSVLVHLSIFLLNLCTNRLTRTQVEAQCELGICRFHSCGTCVRRASLVSCWKWMRNSDIGVHFLTAKAARVVKMHCTGYCKANSFDKPR